MINKTHIARTIFKILSCQKQRKCKFVQIIMKSQNAYFFTFPVSRGTAKELNAPSYEIVLIFFFIFLIIVACVASIVIGVCYASGPFTGAFLNKYGVRISTVIGCLLSSSALAMGSFVDHKNIFLLYVTFSLPFAVGSSFIYVSSTVIAYLYFEKRRSVALGLLTGGQGLGTMILGPALQALQVSLDWRNTFRLFATALFVLSSTGLLLCQGSPTAGENKNSRKLRFNFKLLKKPSVLIRIILPLFFSFSRMVPYVHLVSIMCHSPLSNSKVH